MTTSILRVDSPEFTQLLDACETPALEGFSAAELTDLIARQLNRISAALKNAFRFMVTVDYAKPETLNISNVRSALKRPDYTDLVDFQVNIPVGFTGNLMAYVEHLHKHQLPVVEGIDTKVLTPVLKAFSGFLINPEDVERARVNGLDLPDAEARKQFYQRESAYLIEGNRRAEASFHEVAQSKNEMIDAMTLLNTINDVRWNRINPKHIKKQVDALVQVSEKLIKTIDQRSIDVSKAGMTFLATHIQEAAEWAELYAVFVTRTSDLTSAMKATEGKIIRSL